MDNLQSVQLLMNENFGDVDVTSLSKMSRILTYVRILALAVLIPIAIFLTYRFRTATSQLEVNKDKSVWEVWAGQRGLLGIMADISTALLLSFVIKMFGRKLLSKA
jgi:hypothetical protein